MCDKASKRENIVYERMKKSSQTESVLLFISCVCALGWAFGCVVHFFRCFVHALNWKIQIVWIAIFYVIFLLRKYSSLQNGTIKACARRKEKICAKLHAEPSQSASPLYVPRLIINFNLYTFLCFKKNYREQKIRLKWVNIEHGLYCCFHFTPITRTKLNWKGDIFFASIPLGFT